MTEIGPGAHTRVRRLAERATYDRQAIYAILDEGFVCHLAIRDGELPIAIPTAYGRVDDRIYLHGAAGNAALRGLRDGSDVSLTVTLLDGLVFAKSAFHHSMNYRSAVIVGRAEMVRDEEEKRCALEVIVNHIAPGRSSEARRPDPNELRSTLVIGVDITEASAKQRRGGPLDDPADATLPIWAGELPLGLRIGAPLGGAGSEGLPLPASVLHFRRPGAAIDEQHHGHG